MSRASESTRTTVVDTHYKARGGGGTQIPAPCGGIFCVLLDYYA